MKSFVILSFLSIIVLVRLNKIVNKEETKSQDIIKPKPGCAMVWEDCDYKGKSLEVCEIIPDLSNEKYNFANKISSVKVSRGIALRLHKKNNWEDTPLEAWKDISCINDEYNDKINSIQMIHIH
jgi:hypothetical protein